MSKSDTVGLGGRKPTVKFDVRTVDEPDIQQRFSAARSMVTPGADDLKVLKATLSDEDYDEFVESDDFFRYQLLKAANGFYTH